MDALVRTLGVACLSILLLPTTEHVAGAPGGALVSLYSLTNKADAVVVARIRDVPAVSYNSAHFSIIVERALKGSAAPDQLPLAKHIADSVHARAVAEVAGSRETPEGRSLLVPVDLNGEYIQLNHWPATLFEPAAEH